MFIGQLETSSWSQANGEVIVWKDKRREKLQKQNKTKQKKEGESVVV
jgi:hypothetical protein